MNRHSTIAAALVLFTSSFALPAPAETVHVPADQPTIQAGIDAALDGDTVLVAPGIYRETIDFLGKQIEVASERGYDVTSIWPAAGGPVVRFGSGEGRDAVLRGFKIQGGQTSQGGGVRCYQSSPTVIGNIIRDNGAAWGGGVALIQSNARLEDNIIVSNTADGGEYIGGGGGISIDDSGSAGEPVLLVNNLIVNNLAVADGYPEEWSTSYGGGMLILDSTVVVDHCTVADNWADTVYHRETYGGGLCVGCQSTVSVSNSIFYFDQAVVVGGYELAMICDQAPYATVSFDYSDVQYGPGLFYIPDPGNTAAWGEGMRTDVPRFVHDQPYYLAQVASGQPWNSPCVDAGDPQGPAVAGTTRTDGYPDTGVTDMGFHYPVATPPLIIAGPGPSADNPPLVRVFPAEQDALHLVEFSAYGAPGFGVNVATARLDGQEWMSVIAGPGPGQVFGPHVRGFELDGTPLPGLSFFAYGTLKYGVNVCAGDLDGDGADELVTGAGPGAVFGPHVRAFRYQSGTVAAIPGISFFAYGTLKHGVNVTCGDLDGDLRAEIVTGAGPGAVFGPHVRGWTVVDGAVQPMAQVSYLAYGTPRFGVGVACGDVDGDGMDEILTAPGPSPQFGAHVRGWNCDGSAVAAIPGISFFAWPAGEAHFGARVSSGVDIDGDGRDDILVAPGPDPAFGSAVQAFGYSAGETAGLFSFEAFDGLAGGATVAALRN